MSSQSQSQSQSQSPLRISPLRVHFVSMDKDEPVIQTDIIRWEGLLKKVMNRRKQILCKPKTFSIRDPYMDCDIHIHMGLPIYGAIQWAYVNWVWLGHSEWTEAWDEYLSVLDRVWFEAGDAGEAAAEALRTRCRKRGWKEVEEKIGIVSDADIMESMVEYDRLIKNRKPSSGLRHLPPVLDKANCPLISIVTPTFQRKKLMEIAYHNLLSTDYPLNKIEWIVVEDNDKSPHVMKKPLAEFQQKVPDVQIRYISLEGRRSVGEKRNIGISTASHEWILFMDDDDHYPPTSFRRRMAWLMKGMVGGRKPRIACCTTIALYDLKRGTSAVNVPPLSLSLSQRVSEATFTFHKSVWEERAFPDVSNAEGESWIQGREVDVIEIPPQQIIVAFSHGRNQSSRRVPPSQSPSCFWNFPKEYLSFIHGLVGVDISYE